LNLAKETEKGTNFYNIENRFQGEIAVFKGMVAYVPLAMHTPREELLGSHVVAPGFAALLEW
jgi:hypothetical protein